MVQRIITTLVLVLVFPNLSWCIEKKGLINIPGLYLGLSGIKDNSSYNFRRAESSTSSLYLDFDRFDWYGSGYGGEIFFGYGKRVIKNFSLAIEGFYDASSNEGNIKFIDSNTLYTRNLHGTFRQRWQYGIVARPGFNINEYAQLYGRVGYLISNIQLSGGITQTGVLGGFSGKFSSDKNCQGLQLGLGVEMPLNSRLNARIEWVWNSLQNFTNQSLIKDSNLNTYTTFRRASNITLEQIKVGLSW
ncbi:outer membrane protein [Legionella sp. WA2024007413]